MTRMILILMTATMLLGQERHTCDGRTRDVVVPAGVPIEVRIDTNLSSKVHDSGDRFSGVLHSAITANGVHVAEKHAVVSGRIVGRKRGMQGDELSLELVSIEASCGEMLYPVTEALTRRNEKSVTSGAVRAGSTAALGAAIGGIAGGGRGAAIGAAAGGAVGAAGSAGPGKPVEVKGETVIVF